MQGSFVKMLLICYFLWNESILIVPISLCILKLHKVVYDLILTIAEIIPYVFL